MVSLRRGARLHEGTNNLGIILGGNCGVKKDVREALLWLKRSFREGNDSCSSNNIAMTYRENGNLRQALSWLRKAAKLGDDSVLIQLGVHCYWGKGVRTDPQAAVRYFHRGVCGNTLRNRSRRRKFLPGNCVSGRQRGQRITSAWAKTP